MRTLFFNDEPWKKLKKVCEAGYPREVCGLLFGKISSNGHGHGPRVEKAEVLENILEEKHRKRLLELIEVGTVTIPKERALKGGFFEFLVDPKEHYQKISDALKEGLDQIGLFHSHPDHPPKPSPTDASQPFLVGWSNIIVAVDKGKFSEARSWYRDSEDSPFQEEEIFVQ